MDRAMSLRGHPLLPFAAALAGVGFLSLMDAFMKDAALLIGAYSATVLRAAIGAAISAPLWLSRGPAMPTRSVLKLHLERGVVSAFMALTFFYSLTKLPLAEAIALSFIAPLIALYLARVLLDEVISRAAIGASVLGFAGTLVIVGGRVGQGAFDEGAALGVAALFVSAGRAPLAGIAAVFAGIAGGFSANIFLTGIDPVMSSLSTSAAQTIDAGYVVQPTATWFFAASSGFILAMAGWAVTAWITGVWLT